MGKIKELNIITEDIIKKIKNYSSIVRQKQIIQEQAKEKIRNNEKNRLEIIAEAEIEIQKIDIDEEIENEKIVLINSINSYNVEIKKQLENTKDEKQAELILDRYKNYIDLLLRNTNYIDVKRETKITKWISKISDCRDKIYNKISKIVIFCNLLFLVSVLVYIVSIKFLNGDICVCITILILFMLYKFDKLKILYENIYNFIKNKFDYESFNLIKLLFEIIYLLFLLEFLSRFSTNYGNNKYILTILIFLNSIYILFILLRYFYLFLYFVPLIIAIGYFLTILYSIENINPEFLVVVFTFLVTIFHKDILDFWTDYGIKWDFKNKLIFNFGYIGLQLVPIFAYIFNIKSNNFIDDISNNLLVILIFSILIIFMLQISIKFFFEKNYKFSLIVLIFLVILVLIFLIIYYMDNIIYFIHKLISFLKNPS